ncbi:MULTISPECIES: DUF6715 family protein [unclassified Butyrivibrio]|uniref:DUF6715 family protein n=1 Tax=unclassified Butyrivibrio TaxID=2639466 RepID=UPI0008EFED07|nr:MULTISPECIES: DUF6715 family protein [unclassified Butyrivibrio]RKM59471.1 hypothetical protein D6856_09635 [Butyrivibrio sp. XB500-5]SFU87856.1 hypothetical protein SAMN02910342_02179 [Butyrivibrio sp. INlla21]
MNGTKSAVIKSVVLIFFAALIVLGMYLLLTRNKEKEPKYDESYALSSVDEITTTNLDKNYPANPKKVVELYAKTMQILYRETYSADQELKMITVLSGLMDDELLANQANFTQSMRNEVQERKKEDYSISNYVVLTKDIDETTVDGRKMCHVDLMYSLRKGTSGTSILKYRYVMRQDDAGNWKIMGWDLAPNDEDDN